MTAKARKAAAEEAAVAHTDLNIFAAIQALLESSLMSANGFAAQQRIINICERESQMCLIRYDVALAKLEKGR